MLFYLCEKADAIRIAFGMLGVTLFFVLICLLINYDLIRVRTSTVIAAVVATVLSFALVVLLPDSDLAYEMCRRAGITF